VSDYTEVAIIAAMEREIAPLIGNWALILAHSRRLYENGHVVAVAGGIGERSAAIATEKFLAFRQPKVILSVGLAGSLTPALAVGTVFVPTKVLRQDAEQAFTIHKGEAILLTAKETASPAKKKEWAERYQAQAVDMEAAAVAEVAARNGIRFAAVKAISDGPDFPMPLLDPFVAEDGQFHTGRLLAHAAIRPAMWSTLLQLRRNSGLATNALCGVLSRIRSAADVDELLEARAARAS